MPLISSSGHFLKSNSYTSIYIKIGKTAEAYSSSNWSLPTKLRAQTGEPTLRLKDLLSTQSDNGVLTLLENPASVSNQQLRHTMRVKLMD